MSAQVNSSLSHDLIPRVFVLHMAFGWLAGFRNEDAVNKSAPYPELQEGSPDSNPKGRA